jgi:hypothetical protein
MTLKTVSGVLKQIGPSTINAQVVDYSYLEFEDQLIKKVSIFNGVHGKLESSLGQSVTLHMDGSFVVGVTCADGKTYCSEPFGILSYLALFLMLGAGAALLVFIVGLVFLIAAYRIWRIIHFASLGNGLPNAISLPRART